MLTTDIDLHPNLPGREVFDRAVIAPEGKGFFSRSFRMESIRMRIFVLPSACLPDQGYVIKVHIRIVRTNMDFDTCVQVC